MFQETDLARADESRNQALNRLRWKLYLFVILLMGSGVSVLTLVLAVEPEFIYRATCAGLILTAMLTVSVPYGEISPSAPYALLGFLCFIAVRLLSDHFSDPLALAIAAGAVMLVMSATLAYFAIWDLHLSRFTAILGCMALAGAAAALTGFGSLWFSSCLAALMAVGVVAHALEIRRLAGRPS